MSDRIRQLDFLKCICILLMVMFHLVYIADKFPYAKSIVYTFHMPVFLLISGYLVHAQRPAKRFFTAQWWIFLPYVALELPYVILSGKLGIREADTDLTLQNLAYRIFIHPLGPYWYLHTLIICNISLWIVQKSLRRFNELIRLAVFGIVLGGLVYGTGIIGSKVFYYFIGVAMAQAGVNFMRVFRPSFLSLLIAGLLCCYPANLQYNAPGGVLINYLVISFMLWLYDRCNEKVLRPVLFIGRNTLPVLLFSPVFTMAVKPLVPILSFDPTGMIFLITATSIAVGGSLAIAWTMDRMKVSRWFCGRPTLLYRQPLK